jgi:hypothetical protein
MKLYFEQLKRWWEKLKPTERRWTVFAGMVAFILFNYFFIWPHFGEFGRNRALAQATLATNAMYLAEVNHKAEYERKLKELQADGSSVPPADQAIDFVHFYNSRAVSNQVTVASQGALLTSTNEFFLEQQMGISVQGYETNLVKFLYSLGAGNSMMRVRSMNLHPDPNHMMLNAGLTLVASYQKKPPERPKTNALPVAAAVKPAVVAAVNKTPAPATVPPAKAPPPASLTTNKLAGALARHARTNLPPNSTPK